MRGKNGHRVSSEINPGLWGWGNRNLIIKLFFLLGIIRINFELILLTGSAILIIRLLQLSGVSIEGVEIHRNLIWSLIILRAWICMLIVGANFSVRSKTLFRGLVELRLILLAFCFMVKNILTFYFYFEAVLIPIFLIVLGWGYQPERLSAAFYIFFYTLTASLPLLIAIILVGEELGRGSIIITGIRNRRSNNFLLFLLVIAFMVKFPIYYFHLWLPKAHVEAPVSGSIILAGVLLKLGGYGMFLVMGLCACDLVINDILSTLAIGGAALLSLMILRMSDIKVAIAYSSVVHIRMVIVVCTSNRLLGLIGGIWMIIAHGVTSSGIFRAANIIYERSHSRRLINNKGVLRLIPLFSIMWFLLAMLNFAGPFTINLFSEILIIRRLMSIRWRWRFLIGAICFFSAAYNLNLFASTQQGIRVGVSKNYQNISQRESLVLYRHIWPGILLLVGLLILDDNIKSM